MTEKELSTLRQARANAAVQKLGCGDIRLGVAGYEIVLTIEEAESLVVLWDCYVITGGKQ